MSEVILYQGTAPATPPAGGIAIYAKIDGRLYWKTDAGVETPFYPTGAGTGDLLSDGTIPLAANWDVGAFEITMLRAHFDTTTGQPFTVASSDKVIGLNADQLDGYSAADFQLAGTYLVAADLDSLAKLNAYVLDATLFDWAATSLVGAGFFIDEDNMASDDATKAPSQQSVKAYVDLKTAGANIYQGEYNATTNSPDLTTSPNSILQGQYWVVGTAGTFFTANVEVGDTLIAEQDDPSLEAHWTILQTNLDAATVKTLYESNSDTNEFSDAEQTLLGQQSGTNTGDMTDAAVETAYNNEVAAASQAEMEAGTETAVRRMTPQRVYQATRLAKNKVITGTTYTILEADSGYNLFFTNAAAIAVTLPDTLSTHFHCSIIQTTAAGIPTVTPNTDTINGAATGVAPAAQWKAMYLDQYQAANWIAVL